MDIFWVKDISLPSTPTYISESPQLLRLGKVKRPPSISMADNAGHLISQTQACD